MATIFLNLVLSLREDKMVGTLDYFSIISIKYNEPHVILMVQRGRLILNKNKTVKQSLTNKYFFGSSTNFYYMSVPTNIMKDCIQDESKVVRSHK